MSQSLLYHAFGVREGYEYVRTEYHQGTVEFHLAVTDRLLVCPHCHGREIIRKGKRYPKPPMPEANRMIDLPQRGLIASAGPTLFIYLKTPCSSPLADQQRIVVSCQ